MVSIRNSHTPMSRSILLQDVLVFASTQMMEYLPTKEQFKIFTGILMTLYNAHKHIIFLNIFKFQVCSHYNESFTYNISGIRDVSLAILNNKEIKSDSLTELNCQQT